jgi:hypothetical protein
LASRFAAEEWAAALLMNFYVFALAVMALRSGLTRGKFARRMLVCCC